MKRRLWRIALILSVLIAVVAGGLWPRSKSSFDMMAVCNVRESAGTHWRFIAGSAEQELSIKFTIYEEHVNPYYRQMFPSYLWRSYDAATRADIRRYVFNLEPKTENLIRFSLGNEKTLSFTGKERNYNLTLPHWAVLMLALLLPMIAGINLLVRKTRIREGHCQQCGYDLRATPERCPECGAVPKEYLV